MRAELCDPGQWWPQQLPLWPPSPASGLRDTSLPRVPRRGVPTPFPGARSHPEGGACLSTGTPWVWSGALAKWGLCCLPIWCHLFPASSPGARPMSLVFFPTEAVGLYPRQGLDLMDDPLNVGTKPTLGCSPAGCVFAVVLTTACSPECVTDVHSRGGRGLLLRPTRPLRANGGEGSQLGPDTQAQAGRALSGACPPWGQRTDLEGHDFQRRLRKRLPCGEDSFCPSDCLFRNVCTGLIYAEETTEPPGRRSQAPAMWSVCM